MLSQNTGFPPRAGSLVVLLMAITGLVGMAQASIYTSLGGGIAIRQSVKDDPATPKQDGPDPVIILVEWFCVIVRCDADDARVSGNEIVQLVDRYRASGIDEHTTPELAAEGAERAMALLQIVASPDGVTLIPEGSDRAAVKDGLGDMIDELGSIE